MREWLSANGTVIENLESPSDNFVQAELSCPAETLSVCVADVRPTCPALAGAVSAAEGASPFPDDAGEKDWTKGLADYSAGVTDCTKGTAEQSLPLMQDGVAKVNTGQIEITHLVDLFGP